MQSWSGFFPVLGLDLQTLILRPHPVTKAVTAEQFHMPEDSHPLTGLEHISDRAISPAPEDSPKHTYSDVAASRPLSPSASVKETEIPSPPDRDDTTGLAEIRLARAKLDKGSYKDKNVPSEPESEADDENEQPWTKVEHRHTQPTSLKYKRGEIPQIKLPADKTATVKAAEASRRFAW